MNTKKIKLTAKDILFSIIASFIFAFLIFIGNHNVTAKETQSENYEMRLGDGNRIIYTYRISVYSVTEDENSISYFYKENNNSKKVVFKSYGVTIYCFDEETESYRPESTYINGCITKNTW